MQRAGAEAGDGPAVACAVFDLDGRGNLFRYLWAWLRLLGHLLTHRYDVLHAHHALSGVLLCLTGAPLFSRTVLSYQNSPSHEWGRVSFLLLYPFFRRIILKAPDKDYVRFEKVCVLPNGCDEQLFRPMDKAACRRELGLLPEGRYLLFVDGNPRRAERGRSQKREDRFDAVVERLQRACPQGAGALLALKLHDIPQERMPLYYNAADAYLLTSDFEGSPNAVKECLLCNTQVVSTPVGDMPSLAPHCPELHVCGSFSVEELASMAEKVLETAGSLAAKTSDLSQERMSSREALLSLGYGLDRVAGRLLNLYREIC